MHTKELPLKGYDGSMPCSGRKFDVIAVDACGDDLFFICPHKVFPEETVLQNFKQLLTPTGKRA